MNYSQVDPAEVATNLRRGRAEEAVRDAYGKELEVKRLGKAKDEGIDGAAAGLVAAQEALTEATAVLKRCLRRAPLDDKTIRSLQREYLSKWLGSLESEHAKYETLLADAEEDGDSEAAKGYVRALAVLASAHEMALEE